jgi:hypothetical protein
MPRRRAALDLRRELRAETGTSLNPAQGVQAQQNLDIILDRQQRELWDAYNWPHLKFSSTAAIEGPGAYDYPQAMPFDQILRIWVATSQRRLSGSSSYGIGATWSTPPVRPGHARALAQQDQRRRAAHADHQSGRQMLITADAATAGMLMRIEGQAPLNAARSPTVTSASSTARRSCCSRRRDPGEPEERRRLDETAEGAELSAPAARRPGRRQAPTTTWAGASVSATIPTSRAGRSPTSTTSHREVRHAVLHDHRLRRRPRSPARRADRAGRHAALAAQLPHHAWRRDREAHGVRAVWTVDPASKGLVGQPEALPSVPTAPARSSRPAPGTSAR